MKKLKFKKCEKLYGVNYKYYMSSEYVKKYKNVWAIFFIYLILAFIIVYFIYDNNQAFLHCHSILSQVQVNFKKIISFIIS